MKHSVLFVLLISVAPVGGLAQIVVPDPDEPNQFVISPEAEDDDAEERIRAPKKRKKPAADSVATPEITAIFLAQLEDGGHLLDDGIGDRLGEVPRPVVRRPGRIPVPAVGVDLGHVGDVAVDLAASTHFV